MKKFISILLLGMFLILQSVPGYAWGTRRSYNVVPKNSLASGTGMSQLSDVLQGSGKNCFGNTLPSATGMLIEYVTHKIASLYVEDPTFGGNFWNVNLETCKITNDSDRLFYVMYGFGLE